MLSIVMVTYNRAHLLARALALYAAQPYKDFELLIIDDDSADDTQAVIEPYARQMDIKTILLRKTPGLWRDCARNINLGIRAARGDLVVATHPEVIPGWLSLTQMAEQARDNVYLACKIYYLDPSEQARLDTVNWRSNPLAVRELEGFYTSHPAVPLSDYAHAAMDRHTEWNSWVFGALTRQTWRNIGGMTEFDTWGSIDMDFLMRRHLLRIKTHTLLDEQTICIHQNHDDPAKDTLTNRDLDAARAACPVYKHASEAIMRNL